ncbi:hypothetical protein P691DRAFT_775279 [Macrolepiota fuliginosa MF-IS2]|uniref:DUF6534 domain-containing protein n=1 Tax=Macrolepiota fuliginosa MF-IS2 TaxID=1400762 RepID=A0A9P5XC41_9AGAR|nr:hypothetical protein P691DRAFT_775279 [Macrolepiota fuliginosa MF-IS2]
MKGGPAEAVYGPKLIGLFFNILLYGTMLAQVYIYFTTYKKDRDWMKALVGLLLILDTFNTVVDAIFVYDGLVTHFGDTHYIGLANWYITADPVITAYIGVIVQLFYAWRIHVLIQNWFLVLLVVSVSLAGGVGATYITYKVSITPDYTQWAAWDGIDVTWLGCAGAADILITISLVWYLESDRRRHKTGFKNSDMIVDRVIRVTMQTGLLTSMVAITNLFVFIGDPTGTHLILNTPLCKLYSNSLLSSLNARGGWKFDQSKDTPSHSDTSLHVNSTSGIQSFKENTTSFMSRMTPRNLPRDPTTVQSKPEIFVHVESHEMQDNVLPMATKRPSNICDDREAEGDASSIEDGLDATYPARRRDDQV